LYDIQIASGVQEKLNGLKEYEKQVPDIAIKKDMMNQFFIRPVITWSCSRD